MGPGWWQETGPVACGPPSWLLPGMGPSNCLHPHLAHCSYVLIHSQPHTLLFLPRHLGLPHHLGLVLLASDKLAQGHLPCY